MNIVPNTTTDYKPPRDSSGNWDDRYPRLMVEHTDLMAGHIDRAADDSRQADALVGLIGLSYGSFAGTRN